MENRFCRIKTLRYKPFPSLFFLPFFMKIPLILPQFKRYALYERAMMPKTIKEIMSIVQLFSDEYSQSVHLITTNHIRNFLYQRKYEKMWTNKTFRNKRQYLKTFFDYCIRENYIHTNPVTKIEKPKLEKRLPRCLNKKQTANLLMQLDTYSWYYQSEFLRNQTIIRFFLFTGVRLSELLKLQSKAVNFDESEMLIVQGKGRKDRIIPIHPELLPYLKAYSKAQKQRKRNSEFFFTSIRSDKGLTEKNLYAIVKKLRNACGFHFTPHMLRHTFGKLSIEANLNPFKLKEIMGHSNISTTQIYISVSTESIKKSFFKLHLI